MPGGGGGDGGWDDMGETIVQGDASKLIHMKLLDIFHEMYGNFTVTLEETKLNISDTILGQFKALLVETEPGKPKLSFCLKVQYVILNI